MSEARADVEAVTLWMSPQYAGFPPTAEFHYHAAWLRQHGRNPAMVWRTPQTPAPLPQPVPQVPETVSFDSRCYYRLTTQWRGDGLSLDIINDGKNNTPILAKTAMVPGQRWKLLPEANGAHRLVTQWRGKGLSLANTASNQPLLVDTAAAPEQLWRVTPELDGTLRLTNLAQDASLSLDILYDGKANITPILAPTRDVSGQLWNVTQVAPCP
ncbi:RICIN domain-containing protein [Corallococcus carmarthensis]|uniref:RICIN domain-containing protein n=1 Tax=Corallococcus carmarthensis TaxID=2316728 RepID=UPI00148C5E98|nr:RICIN domain-containing protein [Corallococcus carmarthensis]NOK15617.1 RICIN domain-containing protein [Corallococcus carmarthensis]